MTQYQYDKNNRLTDTTDPEGNTTSQSYDNVGNISTKTDGRNNTTTYTYDSHGRITSQTVGENEISYTYDNNGNQLTMTDSTGTTTREYDGINRVTSKTVPKIGINRIRLAMKEAGIQESEFKYGEFFTILFRRSSNQRVGINEMQKQIIETVLKDPAITAQRLSEVIGIFQRKIEKNISDLKAKGILERKGSRKLGYWEINQ